MSESCHCDSVLSMLSGEPLSRVSSGVLLRAHAYGSGGAGEGAWPRGRRRPEYALIYPEVPVGSKGASVIGPSGTGFVAGAGGRSALRWASFLDVAGRDWFGP